MKVTFRRPYSRPLRTSKLDSVGGQRRRRFVSVKGSYKDAQKELTKLLGQADAGTLADPSKQTVAEYTRANLATAVDLAPKTRERYVELAEHQIIPHLGDIKLAKLKPEHLAEWHAVLLKTLSRRTVLHAHRCLSRVLTDAVALGTLGRNVAAVRRPPASW